MLSLGGLAALFFYAATEIGRTIDFGYGPRYQLVQAVPMAVGGGVLFAKLWRTAADRFSLRRPLVAGGPAVLALAAALVGVVRIAPLVYPHNYTDVHARNAVFRAAHEQELHRAVVFIERGTTAADPLDQTQNLPMELYENDVLFAIDAGPQSVQCVRDRFPNRSVWRTAGSWGDLRIVPY
jgi:hypothetical protein